MADDDTVHIYGTADEKNDPPTAPQGMRGERSPDESSAEAETHDVGTEGAKIPVKEVSGVAYVEATIDPKAPPGTDAKQRAD